MSTNDANHSTYTLVTGHSHASVVCDSMAFTCKPRWRTFIDCNSVRVWLSCKKVDNNIILFKLLPQNPPNISYFGNTSVETTTTDSEEMLTFVGWGFCAWYNRYNSIVDVQDYHISSHHWRHHSYIRTLLNLIISFVVFHFSCLFAICF